jgi:hypothetical protein
MTQPAGDGRIRAQERVESRAFVHANRAPFVIATASIIMQFEPKPLFENASIKKLG